MFSNPSLLVVVRRPKHRKSGFISKRILAWMILAIVGGFVLADSSSSRAALNASSGDFQITLLADANGNIPTGVGGTGGFMVSGNYKMQYAWSAAEDEPTQFINLDDSLAPGGSPATPKTRMIPVPPSTPSPPFSPNQLVKLTLHPVDATSRMYGFHGWLSSSQANIPIGLFSATSAALAAPSGSGNTYNSRLIEILNFGDSTMGLTSLRFAFAYTSNSFKVSAQLPSSVTQLDSAFKFSSYNEPGVTQWDVSNVQVMSNMFFASSGSVAPFNQDISNWDVSKVTVMYGMFKNASTGGHAFNQPIGEWTTTALTKLGNVAANGFQGEGMFEGSKYFNQDLSNWDTSEVTDFSLMFKGATDFNQDLSAWDMRKAQKLVYMFSNATNFNNGQTYSASSEGSRPLTWVFTPTTLADIGYIFSGATNFNQAVDDWKIGTATIRGAFNKASKFNNGKLPGASGGTLFWDLGLGATNRQFDQLFSEAHSFNQNVSSWNTRGGSNFWNTFYSNSYNQPLGFIEFQDSTNALDTFPMPGLSVANYQASVIEWAYRLPLKTDGVLKLNGLTTRPKYSTCLDKAAVNYLESSVANVKAGVTFFNFVSGTEPVGTCESRTVTWVEPTPYAVNPVAAVGKADVYEIVPSSTADNSSHQVKYIVYSRDATSDCSVDPASGKVSYSVLNVSCTIRAYSSDLTSSALSYVDKVFSTSAPTAYSVTYDYNSATSGNSTVSTLWTPGDSAITLPTPGRTGYNFAGWYTESGFTNSTGLTYTPSADITLYARFTSTVTFDSQGGSGVSPMTVDAESSTTLNSSLTRSGYNFGGWYSDTDLTTRVPSSSFDYTPTGSTTLFAKWVSRTQSPLSWNLSSTSVSYQGSLSLGVTGGSGTGSVTYSPSGNSTCTISGSTLTPGQGGSVCVITATKAADADFDAASTAQQTITITKINQSSFSWNLSSTSVAYLGTLTLATTGGSGTGIVVYSVSNTSTCSIVGTTLIPSDAGSTCEITATKVSDTNYNSADTATQTITVTKISQATLSFSNSNALVYGQTMDLLATGGSGGASITYAVSSAGTTGCSLTVNQLSVTGAGTCAVTAIRAASTNYNASSTATLSITVSKASQTVSFSSTIPAEPVAGDTYAVSATASSGLTPTITIASGPCSISNNVVTLTSAGNCVISADSSSTNQYLAATTSTQTVAIGQRNQTLTFSSTVRAMTVKTYGDPVFFAQATTSEPTFTPVYSRGSATTNTACSVSSIGLVVILAVGYCEIEVNQAGDSAVAAASAIKKRFEVLPDVANAPFITSVSAGHESITAAFTAPNYVGGSAITGYQIAAVAGSTTITNSACTLAVSGNTETCTINGLTNGTSYRVKVAAITAAGVGLYSDLSAARVPATNPAAVSAFTAVPDNTTIDLNWQAPISLGGGTFDSYRIFYKLSSSANYPSGYITLTRDQVTNLIPVSYTITGLVNGESYDVRIVTVTTANTSALVSNTAEVKETPRTVPEAPATVEVLEVGGQLVITWSTPQSDGGNAITEYRVTINGTSCTLTNALDNLCTIPVPTSAGTYPVEVKAKNDAGLSDPATATFTKAGVPTSGGITGGVSGGSESAPDGANAIQILTVSIKSLLSSGGQVVSVTGKNFAGVTTVLVGGVKAKIISVKDGLIKFTAPRNTDGPATLTLKSPTASAEVVDAFTYSKGIAKVKVAWVLGFVQANTTIKAADKAKLRSALQKNTGTVAVTCVGYQSYSYNTAKDAQTAMGRAKQACSYLKSINPKLSVKTVIARTNLTGTPSRKLAVQFNTSK